MAFLQWCCCINHQYEQLDVCVYNMEKGLAPINTVILVFSIQRWKTHNILVLFPCSGASYAVSIMKRPDVGRIVKSLSAPSRSFTSTLDHTGRPCLPAQNTHGVTKNKTNQCLCTITQWHYGARLILCWKQLPVLLQQFTWLRRALCRRKSALELEDIISMIRKTRWRSQRCCAFFAVEVCTSF